MPDLTAQQLMAGVERDGADADNLAEAFDYLDDDLIVYSVVANHDAAVFSWLKWWSGDTEVGYIFFEGTVDVGARISDGEITECVVMAPL